MEPRPAEVETAIISAPLEQEKWKPSHGATSCCAFRPSRGVPGPYEEAAAEAEGGGTGLEWTERAAELMLAA